MKKIYDAPELEIDKFLIGDIRTEGVSGGTGLNPDTDDKGDFDF